MTMLDRFYTPKEAADMLQVSEGTVVAWIHAGTLAASNCSKSGSILKPRWRIASQEICRFMMARLNPASDSAKRESERGVRRKIPKPTKQYV
jgi:excisionase family DNA binding protein